MKETSYSIISICYDLFIEPFISVPKQLTTTIFSRQFVHPARVRILEVAGGTGTQGERLAKKGFAVYVLEKAPGMIRQIRKKIRRLGGDQFSVFRADAARMPLATGRFDGIVVQMSLHEMDIPTRNRCVSEMKRVAKDNAVFVFIDFVPVRRLTLSSLLILLAERLAGPAHYRNGRQFVNSGGLFEFMHCNGFQPVRSFSFFQGNIALAVAVKQS